MSFVYVDASWVPAGEPVVPVLDKLELYTGGQRGYGGPKEGHWLKITKARAQEAERFIRELTVREISFNTGRDYTSHGQRIAAKAIDEGVYMVDIDRGISYWFPGVGLNQFALMRAYDYNKPTPKFAPPSMDTNNAHTPGASGEKIEAHRALREHLEELARQVPDAS